MKYIITLSFSLLFHQFISAQNVGIGKNNPTQKLDVQDTVNSAIAKFNGANSMYITLSEKGLNRGYIGSYAGNPQDVDFGTYDGNLNGSLHLTIQDAPKLTITPTGKVGIGTTTPAKTLQVAGDAIVNGDITLDGIINTEIKANAILAPGWENYGNGYDSVKFFKDKMNMVFITGLVKSTTGNNNPLIFQLPLGYRPKGRLIFANFTFSNGTQGIARIDISTDGFVEVVYPSLNPTWLSLSGIAFKTE